MLLVLTGANAPTLAEWARALLAIRDEKRALAAQEREIESELAAMIPRGGVMVDGVGRLRARKRKSRTQWDTEALRRAVLDSRLVDRESGEVADESPLDKVLHVWHLGTPRTSALRDRDLDPDEFCTVEEQGMQVQVQRSEDEPWA